jgi:hypothetical protein
MEDVREERSSLEDTNSTQELITPVDVEREESNNHAYTCNII